MEKQGLYLRIPLMNAAGSLGLAPNPRSGVDFAHLGAFVTYPIAINSRSPVQNRVLIDFPGGYLLHTGLPALGYRKALREAAQHWARAPLPVIVHLLADTPSNINRIVHDLEGLEGVMGIELGFEDGVSLPDALALLHAAMGELPVICNLPAEKLLEFGEKLCAAGAVELSMAARRGALPGPDGPLVVGRLYGPALFPQALRTVQQAARLGLPVIGCGGIYHPGDAEAMLAAGALAVQLDGVFWRGDWEQTVNFQG